MTIISDLISNIKTRINTVLPEFNSLDFENDILKNTFKGNNSRYGVLAKAANQVNGTLRSVDIEQTFEVTLTDGFINKPNSDSNETAKVSNLQNQVLSLYLELNSSKAGSPSVCINVSGLQISSPEIIRDSNLIVQKFTFNIRYRTNI